MINRILATIDSSRNNQSVFDTAVSLARATKAKLILLHILSETDPDYPILPTHAYYSVLKGSDNGIFYQKFKEYKHQQAESLSILARKAIAAGVNTEYTQISGIPGYEICELASRWSADLILIGSRGLKGVKEMFLGSVSNYVTHHAPCSVLIVRNDTNSVSHSIDLPDEKEEEAHREREPNPDRAYQSVNILEDI